MSAEESKPSVAVVLVSYNCQPYVLRCLHALGAQTHTPAELIVVDNASTDGTAEALRKLEDIRLEANEQNLGFAKACNQGAALAQSELLLFLNPDTEPKADALEHLLAALAGEPSRAAAGPRLAYAHGRYAPESKRGLPTPWRVLSKVLGLARVFPTSRWAAGYYMGHLPNDKPSDAVEVLSGACVLVRREAFEQVGGFDERYFMYAEDIDLSRSLRQAGYKLCYVPAARVVHHKGKSRITENARRRLHQRAVRAYIIKWYKPPLRWVLQAGLAVLGRWPFR